MTDYNGKTTNTYTDVEYKATLVQDKAYFKNKTLKIHTCSQCYLSSMAFFMSLLGIFLFSMGMYITGYNEFNITYETTILLIILGCFIVFMGILLWVATCNYKNLCAKGVLILFSIVSFVMFTIISGAISYWLIWTESNGSINSTTINNVVNETIYDTYELCCDTNHTNTTNVLSNICYDILGHNTSILTYECQSFSRFSVDFIAYINGILVLLLVFGCITMVINLFSGISACKLVWLYNRVYYYSHECTV